MAVNDDLKKYVKPSHNSIHHKRNYHYLTSQRYASYEWHHSEEREFKKSTTIVSKATQTPFFTIDKKGTSGKSEYEERLKFQAWNDAKFFVTNQLLAQCLHTPNCTNVLSSTETYPSTKS
ncbi:Uncharacterized protein BM_BM329 [Brugia malayi]|uniref:Bm329 n=1 Tax=Brugia malayi TaxID=6279 RepID=A0A4E9ESV1_BRUMA|nr:Uncharacterized protein BM_BM329 [Brugia malayi]VIO87292.1 Uncharacterized protein BM_BM329 [Brugia malayi]